MSAYVFLEQKTGLKNGAFDDIVYTAEMVDYFAQK